MKIETNWLLHVTSMEDSDDDFVEVADVGIPDADEIAVRSGRAVMKFICSSDNRTQIWTRHGLELLHEAVGQYLRAVREREES